MGMNTASVQRLYVAYFNRPADPISLAVYEAMLPTDKVATQTELLAVAETYFSPSAEYTSNFEGKSNSQIVNQLYQNIFGREAEADGLISWATALTNGSITVAELALQLSFSAQGTDAAVVDARIEAATTFTDGLDTAEEITGYSGDAAAAQGRAYLAQISGELPTDVATITAEKDAAIANVDASIQSAVDAGNAIPGSAFTLTTGVDRGAEFTGGNGDDTYSADLSTAGANTLNTLDRLDGGAGNDTLNAVVATTVTPTSLAGIENIVATATANVTLGLANAAAVTSVTASGSTGALTVTGIAAGADLAVQSTGQAATFSYASTAGAQSANLSVAGVTGAATITVDGVETIAVTGTGASTYQLDADSASGLTFAGAGSQTITLASMTAVSNFNASAATGAVDLTLINQSGLLAATDLSVSGGAGSDTLTVSAHTQSDISVNGGDGNDTITHTAIAVGETVDGGDGTDILSTTSARANALDAATPTTYTITNVETLSVSDQLAAGVLTTQNIATSIDKTVLANSAADTDLAAGAATIVGGAGEFAVDLGSANAANTGRVLGAALTVTDTGSATTDTVTLANKSTVTATGLAVDVFGGQAVTSTGYENVAINTGAATGGAQQDISTLTLTPDATDAAVSLTVTGANALDIATSLTTTSTALMTVDASGMNAQAAGTTTFDIGATSQATGGTASITGSAGDDNIIVGNFASTIDGGAGNDTVTGGTAADNLSGGDGVDTISDGGGNDTINGGAGADSITISGTSVSVDGGDGNDTINADATLSTGDVVIGGDGTDTLAIDAAATASSSQGVSGFEVLRADTALTQDMVQFTTNTGFVSLVSAVADNVTFNNVGANTNQLLAISTGGGNAVTFDRLLDSGANELTFGTATDANTTIATLTVADEETLNIVAGGATTAGRTFAITALAAEDLVTLNVAGNTVFSTTIGAQTTASLTTVDASSASGTVSVSATNATKDLTMTGSASAASTLTGGSGADSITGGAAADQLTGGTGADTIDGGANGDALLGGGNGDSITGGEGADTITGGTGSDTIVLTETTAAVDDVIFASAATNGVDTLVGFSEGTGIDTITFLKTDTTVATAGAAGLFETIAAVSLVTSASYLLTAATATTAAVDVIELLGTNASNGDLSASTTGTELFKLLGTADSAATSITMDNNDDNVLLVAYDNGNAYIYQVADQATGATAIASEVLLIGVINDVEVGGIAAGDLVASA